MMREKAAVRHANSRQRVQWNSQRRRRASRDAGRDQRVERVGDLFVHSLSFLFSDHSNSKEQDKKDDFSFSPMIQFRDRTSFMMADSLQWRGLTPGRR